MPADLRKRWNQRRIIRDGVIYYQGKDERYRDESGTPLPPRPEKTILEEYPSSFLK